jgi:hypothetical protein
MPRLTLAWIDTVGFLADLAEAGNIGRRHKIIRYEGRSLTPHPADEAFCGKVIGDSQFSSAQAPELHYT